MDIVRCSLARFSKHRLWLFLSSDKDLCETLPSLVYREFNKQTDLKTVLSTENFNSKRYMQL